MNAIGIPWPLFTARIVVNGMLVIVTYVESINMIFGFSVVMNSCCQGNCITSVRGKHEEEQQTGPWKTMN